jgi:HD-GYP domain-containing protein (c-di-GMP phosphodiesterase class II)
VRPWRGVYARIPEIAYAHHERMNGSGYPRRLRAAEIPIESRMIAIADCFDALVTRLPVVRKRPDPQQAIDILHDDAKNGRLDQDLVSLFVASKIFKRPVGES